MTLADRGWLERSAAAGPRAAMVPLVLLAGGLAAAPAASAPVAPSPSKVASSKGAPVKLELRAVASFKERAGGIAFAPDGHGWAAAHDGAVIVFRDAALAARADAEVHAAHLGYLPAGGQLLVGPRTLDLASGSFVDDRAALTRALVAGLPPGAPSAQFAVADGAAAPDGAQVVVRTQYLPPRRPGAASYANSGSRLLLLRSPSFELVHDLVGGPAGTGWRAVALDGARVAAASERGGAVWARATGALVGTLGAAAGAVNELRFSQDGQLLAAGGTGAGHNLALWSGTDLKPVAAWNGDPAGINAVAFVSGAGGPRLLSGGDDHHLKLWSLPDGKLLASAALAGRIRALAVSPDGRRAAVATWLPADPELTLYDLAPLP
jgi:WD40 repeat protein